MTRRVIGETNCDGSDFWWNKRLLDEFDYMGISANWKLKAIQGFVGQRQVYVSAKTVNLMIISRKKVEMGCISETGINDEGIVANDVVTEQIMAYEGTEMSFLIERGSVPCFYEITDDEIELKRPI